MFYIKFFVCILFFRTVCKDSERRVQKRKILLFYAEPHPIFARYAKIVKGECRKEKSFYSMPSRILFSHVSAKITNV